MSNFDNIRHFPLIISVSEEYRYLVRVILYNSNNRIIDSESSNPYQISFLLSPGVYTLRIEINGNIKDEIIFIDKEKTYQIGNQNSQGAISGLKIITPPEQFSSALLGESYASTHEYYTNPAIEWSEKDTLKMDDKIDNTNSSLFIFLRFPSIEKYEDLKDSFSKPFYSEFEILDEFGDCIIDFRTKKGIEINLENGWIAFNSILSKGIYYLFYKGKEPRQIPIYIYSNWHTQLFITLGSQPLFGTTRVFMSEKRRFNPYDRNNKYIDILLDKLQNQDFYVDNELIRSVAYGKYESPMLGLICSYLYFASKDTISDDLFRTITKNMQNVILRDNEESPDLRALNILAANHFSNKKYKKGVLKGTPMFRIGFEAILKASVENKKLISQNSINDFVSENLYFDSPFNTFKPIPFKKRPKEEITQSVGLSQNIFMPTKGMEIDVSTLNIDMLEPMNNQIERNIDVFNQNINYLIDDDTLRYIQNLSTKDNSWVQNSIVELINLNDEISIDEISSNLSISGNTVNRIFKDWKKEAKKIKRNKS